MSSFFVAGWNKTPANKSNAPEPRGWCEAPAPWGRFGRCPIEDWAIVYDMRRLINADKSLRLGDAISSDRPTAKLLYSFANF